VKYLLNENDGIFTIKNKNTIIGFDRFNDLREIEYILVNPFFRKKKLAKIFTLVKEEPKKSLCYRNSLVHWEQNC